MSLESISQLLSQAQGAHHEFEQTVLGGVFDEEWPAWYADYVVEHGLNELLPRSVTAAELGQFLAESNRRYEQAGSTQPWADFAASEIQHRFG